MEGTIEISKLIPWIGSAFVVIVAGTYTIAKFLNKSHLEALKERIITKDEKINDLEKTIEVQEANIQEAPKRELVVPSTIAEKLPGDLRSKFEQKKKELYEIIVVIQQNTENLFDPNSEIGNLSEMLKSEDVDIRKQGAKGLFSLNNENVLSLLSAYFFLHEDEATQAHLPSISEWLQHFDSLNCDSAISFCINLIKNGKGFNAEVAYKWLINRAWGINYNYEEIKPYYQELKGIALTNVSALRRTWVKKLIEFYDSVKDKQINACDQRTIFNIILDIEKYLKENLPKKDD